jgi:ribosomal protein S27AE
MGYSTFRRPKAAKSRNQKPHSWSDLDDLGLPRSHWFDRFVEIGQQHCPRCGNDHISITWINHTRRSGWQWTCGVCAQMWRQPQIIPRFKARTKTDAGVFDLDQTQDPVEYSESDTEIIRRYK